MSLDWVPRDHELKDHNLFDESLFSDQAPGVMYELRPIMDDKGLVVPDLCTAWIILNNPEQLNSYTTKMVKGVIAGFYRASMDRSVVAVVFTAMGSKAFCTGGNTKEYAEYYSGRPEEYGQYMDLFIAMVDAILNCKKPVINRVNGMRVAGGQEIGMACDLTIAADTAIFGQAGPRHGSAPDGGSTDFLPWLLPLEQAMWSCVSCEMWSAYKMLRLGLITEAVPVLKLEGKFITNPLVITDQWIENGRIVFGERLSGHNEIQHAKGLMEKVVYDSAQLDTAVNRIVWTFTNLFPGCLMKSIDGIRQKKKSGWDQNKLPNRHWLAANMQGEGSLGFTAFNTKKITGSNVIDFIKYRQLLAEGHPMNEELFEAVLGKPQES